MTIRYKAPDHAVGVSILEARFKCSFAGEVMEYVDGLLGVTLVKGNLLLQMSSKNKGSEQYSLLL